MQSDLSQMLKRPGQGFGVPPAQNRFMQNIPGQITEPTKEPLVSAPARPKMASRETYNPGDAQHALLEYVKQSGDVNFPEFEDWMNWIIDSEQSSRKSRNPNADPVTPAQREFRKKQMTEEVLRLGHRWGIDATPEQWQRWKEQERREKIRQEIEDEKKRQEELEAAERRRREDENIRRRMRGQPTLEEEEAAAEAERQKAEAEAQYQKNLARAREAQERSRKTIEDARRRAQQAMSGNWRGPSVL